MIPNWLSGSVQRIYSINRRIEEAVCICLSNGTEGGVHLLLYYRIIGGNRSPPSKHFFFSLDLYQNVKAFIIFKLPHRTLILYKLSFNVSYLCDSCWCSNTEQLTASIMSKQTKPSPSNSTETWHISSLENLAQSWGNPRAAEYSKFLNSIVE